MNNLFINGRTNTELLEAAKAMALEAYQQGWRLHRVQFADLEKIEYQHFFADSTPDGWDTWDPEEDPYDIVFFYVDVYRADGETHYIRNENGWELLEDKELPYAPEAEE